MTPQTARLHPMTYGGYPMHNDEDRCWPNAGVALLAELKTARGRLALVVGDLAGTDSLVGRLVSDLGLSVVHLGLALAGRSDPPAVADLEAVVGVETILADLDLLMWSELDILPLALLTSLARRRPTIAVWPGEVTGRRARYSRPGRPDHHELVLHDTVLLRPRATTFPDELPYDIERIAP